MGLVKVSVGRRKLSIEKILSEVPETSGACVMFLGVVRGREASRRIEKLEYSAYKEMAMMELTKICNTVSEKYGADAIYIHHRIGKLKPGEPTLYIVVYTPHRNESFAACREILELIKRCVPIWKKEFVQGEARWK